jgi:hypothetical protein
MAMDWKNQLTRTPYLVLFIVLISIGVGTASALITITLSGDVHVTGDTTLDGDLSIGTDEPNDDDTIKFDDGTKTLTWDDSMGQFVFSDSLNIDDGDFLRDNIFFGGVGAITYQRGVDRFEISKSVTIQGPIHTGLTGSSLEYNTMGFPGSSQHGLDSEEDLMIVDDLEVGGAIFVGDNLTVEGMTKSISPGTPAVFDRTGGDGPLIIFDKAGVGKGSISISGETVSYNAFTGSHYAWTNDELKRGLLVSMNGDNKYLNDNPNNEILYGVETSQTKNDPAILGTYLSVLDTSLSASLENPHLVTSDGNGEVWVIDTGVDIVPGDLFTSSSIKGHAMKDDSSEKISYTFGRAAESIEWDEVQDTVDGIKHKKISLLFNFVPLNNQILE